MSAYTYSPEEDPRFDEDDDQLTPEAAQDPAPAYNPAPRPPLANPVIKSFEAPAQAATNTVPEPEPKPAPVAPVAPVRAPQPAAVPAAPIQPPALYVPPGPPAIPPPALLPVSYVYDARNPPAVATVDPEEQRAQYLRDQAASLKYHKSQGGQTETLPTGQEVPKTDAAGNALYHPAVVAPFHRGEDGKGYRVSRDEYGNEHHFDLAQGAEGNDFHVDPQTGEMYVPVSGADGGSRREVIGHDPLVPQITALKSRLDRVLFQETNAGSGIEFATDGTMRIDPAKLAVQLDNIRAQQAKSEHQLAGTPEEYLNQVLLAHEGLHGAQNALAKEDGMSLPEHIEKHLPDAAMPEGWEATGRDTYGPEWDKLESWQKKAEFTRMWAENEHRGTISEAFYKYMARVLDYLKRVASGKGVDPRVRAYVDRLLARLEAARNGGNEQAPAASNSAPVAKKAPRAFKMPTAPTGHVDVLDHLAEQGGMVSPTKAKTRPSYAKYAGDYDGAPTLGGFYHHAVYGRGKLMERSTAQPAAAD